MKIKSICIYLITVILLLLYASNSYSQVCDCTDQVVKVCGGTYVSFKFRCSFGALTLPEGLTQINISSDPSEGGINTTVIQGTLVNKADAGYVFHYPSSSEAFELDVYRTPTITSVTSVSVCSGDPVNLNAVVSGGGTLHWYDVSSGGISLATDPGYSPSISATMTYYVDATISGTGYSCTTSLRTPVLATVNKRPVVVNKEIIVSSGCTNGNKSGIRIKAIEGSGQYTYLWNTGDTLPKINCLTDSNYYKVTVIDTVTHCIGTDSIWLAPGKSDSIEILQEQNTLLRIDTAVKAWEILYLKNQLAQGKYTSYDTLNISLVLHDTTYVIDMHNLDTIVNLNGFTSQIKIYPNPVGEILKIECSVEMTKCEVTNLLGVAVISNNINTDKTQLDASSLVTGEYLLKISLARGGTIAGRMLIKK